ncbi:MAG: DUF4249 family protein [Rhodothermales bacterium]|nr:DUF4249 family protein [Rhodothermales bacterium]
MLRTVLLLLVLVAAGCSDTTLDPFDNDARYFTVYGFLDQLETHHQVRVIPVTRSPELILAPTEDHRIDAKVFSTDLTTGQLREWDHDFQRLDDGTYGHVFRSRFLVAPGRRYRLEVIRADGKMAWAETQVPVLPDAALYQKGDIIYSADSTDVRQEIVIPKIPSPWDINAIYLLNNQNNGSLPGGGALQSFFFVPYGRAGSRTDDGGWRVTLDLAGDSEGIRQIVSDYRAEGVYDDTPETVVSIGVQVRILDSEWDPPEGVFDPEVLAQPDVIGNVQQGYGHWGSVGVYREEWPVGRALAKSLGYEW